MIGSGPSYTARSRHLSGIAARQFWGPGGSLCGGGQIGGVDVPMIQSDNSMFLLRVIDIVVKMNIRFIEIENLKGCARIIPC